MKKPKTLPVCVVINRPGLAEGVALDLYAPGRILVDAEAMGERNSEPGLNGLVGQLLYTALTGHRFGHHPHDAHPLIAAQARALIESRAGQSEAYYLAYRVLSDWGLVYQPWLGMLAMDAEGEVIESHPCYNQRMLLPGGTTWKINKSES